VVHLIETTGLIQTTGLTEAASPRLSTRLSPAATIGVAGAIVGIAAGLAWSPEPLRGAAEVVAGIGGPTWALAALLESFGVPRDVSWPAGAMITLATWSLAVYGLLAVGAPLNRATVLGIVATLVAGPIAFVEARQPVGSVGLRHSPPRHRRSARSGPPRHRRGSHPAGIANLSS